MASLGTIDVKGLQYLKRTLEALPAKAQRGAIRKMTDKGSSVLQKEIKRQIKMRDMPYSRRKNAASRKRTKQRGQKPLLSTIKKKYWAKPARGIVGYVVGATWPAGSHAHLVEWGHRITGHARMKFRGVSLRSLRRKKWRRKTVRLGRKSIAGSGTRTVEHRFQESAMQVAENDIYHGMVAGWKVFLAKQHRRF